MRRDRKVLHEEKKSYNKRSICIASLVFVIVVIICLIVGFKICNISKANDTTTSKMSESEINAHNYTVEYFSKYDILDGDDVEALLEAVIEDNDENFEKYGKFISIHIENMPEFDEAKLAEVGKKANCFEDSNGNNTLSNVNEAKEVYRELKKVINFEKKYKISTQKVDGLIYSVTIQEQ